MSKVDTMKPGDTILLRFREDEDWQVTIRVLCIDRERGTVKLATDAPQAVIIARAPMGKERAE